MSEALSQNAKQTDVQTGHNVEKLQDPDRAPGRKTRPEDRLTFYVKY